MLKKSIFAVLLYCLPPAVFARESFQAGIGFLVGMPRDAFCETAGKNGFGMDGYVAFSLPDMALLAGVSGAFLIYGCNTWDGEQFPYGEAGYFSSGIFMGHLLLRLQPPAGSFRPYMDGFLGYLLSITDGYDLDASNGYIHSAVSYGGGGGVMYRLCRIGDEADSQLSVYLDIGFRCLTGGEDEHVNEESNSRDGFSRPAADIVAWHAGMEFGF
jgi:hypothetical protein